MKLTDPEYVIRVRQLARQQLADHFTRFPIEVPPLVMDRLPVIADSLISALIDDIRTEFGGLQTYVDAHPKQARNAAIKREFNGRNIKEIAQRYSISERTVYRLVGRP